MKLLFQGIHLEGLVVAVEVLQEEEEEVVVIPVEVQAQTMEAPGHPAVVAVPTV
jgi:hypothetical protein